jgi:eukaryotic-like serine/threonine-protein kinase
MVSSSVSEFVESMRQNHVLEPEQLDEVTKTLQAKFPDPRALARQLIQMGWLTPFQVNQLLTGKGGTLVMGSYTILERLGEGGMGIVYKARNWKLGRIVALKVIRREHVTSTDAIRRFRREIEVVGKLSHPNIVMALDADDVGGTHFFVMEYVEGVNLSALLKQNGPPPVALACEYMRQVASGLQQAFERGMVHRDIKPANLLVQRSTENSSTGKQAPWGPTIKILDMGVARLAQVNDSDSISALTKDGRVVGTPDYMAPEQAVNSAKADVRADLYSLGCTFYNLLTGQPPFPGGTPMEKLLKHRMDQPKPVEQIRPEVPPAVASVVRKLMAKKAEDRYQTPAELGLALDAIFPKSSSGGMPTIRVAIKPAAPTVPVAVAVTGPDDAGVPVAQAVPGDPFAFGTSPTAPMYHPQQRSSEPNALKRLLADRKTLPLVIGAIVTLILGLIFLIVAVASSGPRKTGKKTSADPLTAMLQELGDRPTRTAAEREALREEIVRFRVMNLGTPQSLGAARLLTRLPSPLDDFKANLIPVFDRPAGLPAEVVAVLGEHRQRHWGAVRSVALSANGQLVASGGDDKVIRLWDSATMRERAVLAGHSGTVSWLAFSPDNQTLASAGQDGMLRVWENLLDNQPRLRLEPIPLGQSLRVAAFSPDGRVLAFLGDDRSVSVLDLVGLKPGSKPKPRNRVVTPVPVGQALAYHPTGQTLAIAGTDNVVTLWDLTTAQPRLRAQLRGHEAPVLALAFSRDGRQLATAGQDHTIRLWGDVTTAGARHLRTFQGHTGDVLTLAYAPNGQTIFSSGTDRMNLLWDLTGQRGFQPVSLPAEAMNPIHAVAFSANSIRLVTAGQDTSVRVWEGGGGAYRERFPLRSPVGATTSLAFSPTGSILASGNDGDELIHLWNLAHNKVGQLPGQGGGGYHLAFAPDRLQLASASSLDNVVQLWDVDALDRRGPSFLPPQTQRVLTVAFSPTGKVLATTSMDRMINLWNVAGTRPRSLTALQGHRQPVSVIAFSPDGKKLASVSPDDTLRLWDLETGRQEQQMPALHVRSLAFSPDSSLLAFAGGEAGKGGEIRLLDVAEGRFSEKRSMQRSHSRPVTSLAFLPDGEGLVSAGEDGQVIVHGPSSGQPLHSWRFPGAVRQVSIACDGRHVATANANGTIYLLRIRAFAGKS